MLIRMAISGGAGDLVGAGQPALRADGGDVANTVIAVSSTGRCCRGLYWRDLQRRTHRAAALPTRAGFGCVMTGEQAAGTRNVVSGGSQQGPVLQGRV